jgi:hypothetical protein
VTYYPYQTAGAPDDDPRTLSLSHIEALQEVRACLFMRALLLTHACVWRSPRGGAHDYCPTNNHPYSHATTTTTNASPPTHQTTQTTNNQVPVLHESWSWTATGAGSTGGIGPGAGAAGSTPTFTVPSQGKYIATWF